MDRIADYFGCGKVEKVREDMCCNFSTAKFIEIYEIVIPFFEKYKLKGSKALNYSLVKEAVNLVQKKITFNSGWFKYFKKN